MRTLVSIITLGLAIAFTAPVYAAAPTSKAACERAHMTWDASAKKCR